ncbi:MAG: hypothetical protein A2785_03955 [Candidatus Chisholmbacteria bacterium RIFCSPHIGHO2_01_FULL_49_18]|uniref:Addiction module toxin, HicA family n=1 Tax=Candidatus Chisholmbacteria bacterium RIFCSPHIGHO2_01_FULL_49_18 TaxID=1797590 RepID=A0A1G1VPQ4_9BACT|nr:MAG: hypothetical protein A2785_03955 [Candidatus Chisholmbacteria bacterium RIFCSPHIGHO2_01_FULL_49_18]
MTRLPAITHREVIKAARKLGFLKDHQRGSHLVMRNPQNKLRVVIPIHAGRTLKKGTLKGILQDLEISTKDFVKLLKTKK